MICLQQSARDVRSVSKASFLQSASYFRSNLNFGYVAALHQLTRWATSGHSQVTSEREPLFSWQDDIAIFRAHIEEAYSMFCSQLADNTIRFLCT